MLIKKGYSSKVLECRAKNCLAINHTKSVSSVNSSIIITYVVFECVLIPSFDNIDFGPNNKKYQDHIVCSYGHKLIYVDEEYSRPYKSYFGEDVIEKFISDTHYQVPFYCYFAS